MKCCCESLQSCPRVPLRVLRRGAVEARGWQDESRNAGAGLGYNGLYTKMINYSFGRGKEGVCVV